MLDKLAKLANKLDVKGFYAEADLIDTLIKEAGWARSSFIRAVKNNDWEALKHSLTGVSAEDLGIGEKDLSQIFNVIQAVKEKEITPDGALEGIRIYFGIGKNTQIPLAPSSLPEKSQSKTTLTRGEKTILHQYVYKDISQLSYEELSNIYIYLDDENSDEAGSLQDKIWRLIESNPKFTTGENWEDTFR